MDRKRHAGRDALGRFVARGGGPTELKRGRGNKAAGRPQIRARHKRALTARQIEIFLTTLAQTCNVALSARRTGRQARNFYDLRRRDPGFRAAWLQALSAGYDYLEVELLRRLRFGTPKDVFYQGRKTGTTRTFNDGAALRLLHFHRKTVQPLREAESGRRDGAAIFDELAARLAEIKAEKAAKAAKEAKEAKEGETGDGDC